MPRLSHPLSCHTLGCSAPVQIVVQPKAREEVIEQMEDEEDEEREEGEEDDSGGEEGGASGSESD